MTKKVKMVPITIHVPPLWIEAIDRVVEKKLFPNRAEFIRAAIRNFLMEVNDPEVD